MDSGDPFSIIVMRRAAARGSPCRIFCTWSMREEPLIQTTVCNSGSYHIKNPRVHRKQESFYAEE